MTCSVHILIDEDRAEKRSLLLHSLTCCLALMLMLATSAKAAEPVMGPSNDWDNVSDHLTAADKQALQASGKGEAMKIRLAGLPSRVVQATPDQRVSKSRVDVWEKAQIADAEAVKPKDAPVQAAPAPKPKAETPACDTTVSEMRQRRLAAIESDKRTLAALRQALHDMKMTQKLSFMVDQASGTEDVAPTKQTTH